MIDLEYAAEWNRHHETAEPRERCGKFVLVQLRPLARVSFLFRRVTVFTVGGPRF